MEDKFTQFTLEEIYLAEIIQNSIKKIQGLSEEEFRELRNYPV